MLFLRPKSLASLSCLILLVISVLSIAEAKKKKSDDDEEEEGGKDKEQKEGGEADDTKSVDWEDLLNNWKDFKMPLGELGVPSFKDMYKCMAQSMKTGMKKHPDIGKNLKQVITAHGYPVEVHFANTEDGFRLAVHRIPHSEASPAADKKPVVLLGHDLAANGHQWVLQWQDNLAYTLADEGFDVWIANFRGSRYSQRHQTLTPAKPEFWEFTFDEVGRQDIPTIMDKITEVTKAKKMFYIGHGLGTTSYVVAMTEKVELQEKIEKAFLLGPEIVMTHSKGFLRGMSALTANAQYKKSPILGGKGQSAQEQFSKMDMKDQYNKFCRPAVFSCFGCSSMYFTINGGFDGAETNFTMLPLIAALYPDKVSTKTLVHYGQMITSGNFSKFDYGSLKDNQKNYESKTPPEYDLSKLSAPIVLAIGLKDQLAPPEDAEEFAGKVPEGVIKETLKVNFTHGGFAIATKAKEQLYLPMIKLMKGN